VAGEGKASAWDGWYQVSSSAVEAGGRIHTRLDGRYVTVFNRRSRLSAIDSICHHAGGPLTEGALQDIEDLNVTVVLCPWHRYMVSLDGFKVFQGIHFVDGEPQHAAWRLGKRVQRQHEVRSDASGTYVRLDAGRRGAEDCGSDQHADSELCGRVFELHAFQPIRAGAGAGAAGEGEGEEGEEGVWRESGGA